MSPTVESTDPFEALLRHPVSANGPAVGADETIRLLLDEVGSAEAVEEEEAAKGRPQPAASVTHRAVAAQVVEPEVAPAPPPSATLRTRLIGAAAVVWFVAGLAVVIAALVATRRPAYAPPAVIVVQATVEDSEVVPLPQAESQLKRASAIAKRFAAERRAAQKAGRAQPQPDGFAPWPYDR